MKRSNAPIFWALFGAGGMVSALIGAVLVFITGIAAPSGMLLPRDMLSYSHVLAFSQHWAGKGFLFVIISLFLWHSVHRIFHTLHDIGIHAGLVAKLVCYGIALVGTIIAAGALFRIGF
ncbi:MAG: fumarate reductase subunit FrdD [Pseudomonadota bacterium]